MGGCAQMQTQDGSFSGQDLYLFVAGTGNTQWDLKQAKGSAPLTKQGQKDAFLTFIRGLANPEVPYCLRMIGAKAAYLCFLLSLKRVLNPWISASSLTTPLVGPNQNLPLLPLGGEMRRSKFG